MHGHDPQADVARVAGWIDDLAAHEQATERIMAMGLAAVEPLADYLRRGPQAISQPRVLAVRMLARLHDARVPGLLRRLLHDHPLHGLPPHLAESEYRVKDAAVEALALTQGCATAEDVLFAIRHERLPAAVRAAGFLRLTSLAPALAGLLADDVLAEPAATALSALRPESVAIVEAHIRAWLDAETDTARTRLGLVRGFAWLATGPAARDDTLQRQGLRHPCAAVRAAAALAMREGAAEPVVQALAHGVLGRDGLLALACRDRLRHIGPALFEPAMDALCADAEPDVYGNLHPADGNARRWLLRQVLRQAVVNPERLRYIVSCVAPDELAACLYHVATPSIERHADRRARDRSAVVRGWSKADEKAGYLAGLLGDADPMVRRTAYQALHGYLAACQVRIPLRALPASAWRRSPLRCLRLLLAPRPRTT
jgi:hypothetical protein